MKKNVASQVVSAVVVSATDGSPITASVAVTVTGDAGTQGAGGGTLVHEGAGEWSYVPTQAETNFDHIMFKFSATGAISVGIQVYTMFPQTGDGFARLGAPAGASVSADVAAVKAETATILADTNDIQTRLPAALVSGRIDASVGAMAANVLTATAINADAITDAKVASDVTIASVTGAVGSVTAGVTVTTNNDKTGYALTAPYDFAKGTAAVTESYAANGAAPTPVQAILGIHQMLMQFAISTTSYTVKKLDNSTTAFVVTLDSATAPTSAART